MLIFTLTFSGDGIIIVDVTPPSSINNKRTDESIGERTVVSYYASLVYHARV